MTTNRRLQRRRERAADRLEVALAPGSGHVFGTWKRTAAAPGEDASEFVSEEEAAAAEAAARKDAEFCLANLRRKNVLSAG